MMMNFIFLLPAMAAACTRERCSVANHLVTCSFICQRPTECFIGIFHDLLT